MRIADKMNYEQVNAGIGKNRSEMTNLQNQAATQKRVTKPSDDPLATTRVLQARTEINGNQQFQKSINQAKSFLEFSDQSLGELSDVLMRAKELAISQSSDASASKQTREVAATEVSQLFDQTVQVGNRKQGDRFLFAGYRTTRAPFDTNGNYRGDSGEIKISINKDAHVAMNIPGSRVFLGQGIQTPASLGPAGKMPNSQAPDMNGEHSDGSQHAEPIQMRGPAGNGDRSPAAAEVHYEEATEAGPSWKAKGVNIFRVLSDLETGLRANDKESVQESLDRVDEALSQVVLSRAQLGSRVATMQSTLESLQKGQVDSKGLASSLEDVDTYELVSDINKNESTLKATLATSGKLIQPSLLDFIK
jgi:flagellar hook-associated protein 3 FlgL